MDELFKIFFRIKKRKINRRVKIKRKNLNYIKYKKQAVVLVRERLEYFNTFYNFKYGRVAIRNQKTRWGSCSKKGNLNFNYKIVLLSPKQADYIIVHELCHLKEFNHSQRFWDLVAKAVPDYKEVRHSLRNNSLRLG
jgi:predicted metal-dependent hydrolase